MTVGYTLAQLADAAGIDYLYNGQYGVITDRNGLYYMRARYYDQDIKRFTNRDVVSGDITNSQSLNRYCYVQDNPVSLTDPFGLCPDPNSNFKNFCRTLYCVDWNAVGQGALDIMGIFWDGADVLNAIWYACEGKTKEALTSALCALPGLGMGIGSLMEKTSRFAQAGKTVKYLSRMAQGGMGVVAGISMAKTGLTNILNGLESGNLSGWDVVTFIGGIAITGLSGRNLAISGRGLAGMMDDAGKVAKAGKGQNAGNAEIGNKLDYQFGKAGGNQHNIDRSNGLRAEMDKLGFDDTPENRAFFEKYYNDVLNDPSSQVGMPKLASYTENGVTYYYTITTRESFLMGKNGGAKVTTHWDGNRLLTIKISSGKQSRYNHNNIK